MQCLIQCLAVSCCLFLSHSEIFPIQAKQLLFSRVVGQRQMNRGEGLRAIASQTLSFLNCRSCWRDSQHPVPCIITNHAVQKYSVFHHHRCLEIFFCNGTSDAVCAFVARWSCKWDVSQPRWSTGKHVSVFESMSLCICVFVYSHIYVFLYLCIFVYGLFLGHTYHLPAPAFTKSWKTYVSPRR